MQFLPILLIPLIIFPYNTRRKLARYVWIMIGFCVAAKVFEQLDMPLYGFGELISGHSLKHLLATLAPATLIVFLMRRRAPR